MTGRDYSNPFATQALQELRAQVNALTAERDALKADAARYVARRKAMFLISMRMQVSGPRKTEEEFNTDYDLACDRNVSGCITDHRGVWVKDAAMAGQP